MPIQPINFPNITWEEANPLLTGIQQGQQLGQNLMMFPQQMKAQMLANSINQLKQQQLQAELPYAGTKAKADSDYKIAMARYLSNPYQSQRFMTPLGKTLNERNMLNLNYENKNNDEQYNPYDLEIQKMTTDQDTRKRNLFAANIEKTLGFIDPEKLTQYSGLVGSLKKKFAEGESAFGKEPKKYTDYKKSAAAADFLSKQVRQFYGASITPEMDYQLRVISNPESWVNSPKLAKTLFNQFKDILGAEIDTYRGALKNTKPYQSENNKKINDILGIR